MLYTLCCSVYSIVHGVLKFEHFRALSRTLVHSHALNCTYAFQLFHLQHEIDDVAWLHDDPWFPRPFEIDDLDEIRGLVAMRKCQNVLFGNGQSSIIGIVVSRMESRGRVRWNGVNHIHDGISGYLKENTVKDSEQNKIKLCLLHLGSKSQQNAVGDDA